MGAVLISGSIVRFHITRISAVTLKSIFEQMGVSPAYLSTILALTICCVSTMCEAGLQDVNMWKQDELQTMGFLVQANHRKETVRAILLLTAFTSTLAGLVRVAHAAWTTADEWNITDGKVV